MQLYNVYSALANAADGERTFVMQCPLSTIGMLLNCHRDALARIESELDAGNVVATMHQNGRGNFAHLVFFVAKSYETDE